MSDKRDPAADSLKGFVILLVVFIHAALAYTSFSQYHPENYVISTAPVVDSSRWAAFDLVVIYFDTFIMALMFYLAGTFVRKSLSKRGSKSFFLGRLKKLGLPFLFSILIIAPLTYFPSYLRSIKGETPFLIRFFTSDGWQVGPPWFLWILLVFSGAVAALFALKPDLFPSKGKILRFPVILSITTVSYLALSLPIHPDTWISLGPFDVQISRVLLYFAFYVMGIVSGPAEEREGAKPPNGIPWLIFGLVCFAVYVLHVIGILSLPGFWNHLAGRLAYAGSCAGSAFGFLFLFRRYVRRSRAVSDSFNRCSFGIYLIHYPLVIWLQFLLLPVSFPAWLKLTIVFLGATGLAWGLTGILKKIPGFSRVL